MVLSLIPQALVVEMEEVARAARLRIKHSSHTSKQMLPQMLLPLRLLLAVVAATVTHLARQLSRMKLPLRQSGRR